MNFPSQIFFNDINHGYRAAILKKNSLWLLPFYMVWLLISIMKRCAERCALQFYQTLRSTGPPTAWSCNYHQLHPVIIDDNWRQALQVCNNLNPNSDDIM